MNLVLHVGRHKTGTTYIQEFLALNEAELLRRFALLYPRTGRDLSKHYHHAYFLPLFGPACSLDIQLVDEMRAELSGCGARTVLLSSETLSRPLIDAVHLAKVKEGFGGKTITIVVYLRRQDHFLESTYAERVKRGLLAWPDSIWDVEAKLNYRQFLQPFIEVFGPTAITVRTYEQATKAGLVADFLSALHLATWPDMHVPQSRRNERAPWAYVELLRRTNARPLLRKWVGGQRVRTLASRLARRFPKLMNRPLPMTDVERATLLKHFEVSNQQVALQFLSESTLFDEGHHRL